MANTVIAFPQYGFSGGQTVPILAIDNGDGTYSLGTVAYNQSYKSPVRVATTGAGTLASSFANGQTVDGIVLATGDRILIKNQAAPAANGIYVVAATGAPTRATDFDSWAEIPGAVVGVLVGTTNADTAWICTSDSGGTIGSTAINFSAFGASVNLASPGPIGGTTPGSGAFTTLTTTSLAGLGGGTEAGFGLTITDPDNGAKTGVKIYASNLSQNVAIGWQGILATQDFDIRTAGDMLVGTTGASTKLSLFASGTIRVIISTDGLIQFAGSTSSFPALKRSSTVLQARLADDSAFAPVQGKLTTDANATTGLIAGALAALTNASIVIYDATGTAYRVPCVTP